MKKAIIRDLDGSMLGDVGTVIPEAEFEWDGDPRRGLGDYRIPRTMLTEPDGSRIPTDDIAPNKGRLSEQITTFSFCRQLSTAVYQLSIPMYFLSSPLMSHPLYLPSFSTYLLSHISNIYCPMQT